MEPQSITEYFVVLGNDALLRGPFGTMEEATDFLQKLAQDREGTDKQDDPFFLHGSAIVKMETIKGKMLFLHLGWPPQAESARQDLAAKIKQVINEKVLAKARLLRKQR